MPLPLPILPEPISLLALCVATELVIALLLLWAIARHWRTHEHMGLLQREHRALMVQFREMIRDLDAAARAPVASTQAPMHMRVEEAIARAPETSDAQQLARATGISLQVARTVLAFHGKRRRTSVRP